MGNDMLRNKGARRLLAAFLIVLGGVLIFLAPEVWAGLLLMAVGIAVEAAGIALERQA
jgi:drug/metabolite transporter (DMT)-like permease